MCADQSDRQPRLVIAAPQGRSGKTTVSLGICAALAARGLAVQPFKKGPDYIDPSWLSEAAGRACRSLDAFFMPEPDDLRAAFLKGARQADFSLVEGNHGLYDSHEDDGRGSSAHVARLLQAPVVLVVNAQRMTRSAAALVMGCQVFEIDTPIRGVILNNVAQKRHEDKLRQAIEKHCGIPVLGALPRDEALSIPDRHLGLVPSGEQGGAQSAIEACRQAAEQYLDLDALLDLARQAPPLSSSKSSDAPPGVSRSSCVVGVLRDRAFTFYYPENLEALQEAGAELVFIDSMQEARLPQVDALYIGGGFPEVFMEALAENSSLRQDIRQAVESDLPVYAECGGLMYLARSIRWQTAGEAKARQAPMVGALPFDVEMLPRPQGHGYVLGECTAPNPFFPIGARLRGHEFHHSRLLGAQDWPTALHLERGSGLGNQRDGLLYRNVFAAYTHLHAYGTPDWAPGLAARARGQ